MQFKNQESNQDILESSVLWYGTPLHMLKHYTLFGRQWRLDETVKSVYFFEQ